MSTRGILRAVLSLSLKQLLGGVGLVYGMDISQGRFVKSLESYSASTYVAWLCTHRKREPAGLRTVFVACDEILTGLPPEHGQRCHKNLTARERGIERVCRRQYGYLTRLKHPRGGRTGEFGQACTLRCGGQDLKMNRTIL